MIIVIVCTKVNSKKYLELPSRHILIQKLLAIKPLKPRQFKELLRKLFSNRLSLLLI